MKPLPENYIVQIFDAHRNLITEYGVDEIPDPLPAFPKFGSRYIFDVARKRAKDGLLPKLRPPRKIRGTNVHFS